jgi:hypothetical protein
MPCTTCHSSFSQRTDLSLHLAAVETPGSHMVLQCVQNFANYCTRASISCNGHCRIVRAVPMTGSVSNDRSSGFRPVMAIPYRLPHSSMKAKRPELDIQTKNDIHAPANDRVDPRTLTRTKSALNKRQSQGIQRPCAPDLSF